MIKKELNKHLKAALIAGVGDNVFPMVGGIDQPMPAVTYAVDFDNELDLEGEVVLERYQIQVHSVAVGYEQAESVATEIKESLNIRNGNLNNTFIQLCRFDSDSESFDDELNAYIITLNFTLIA